MILKVNKDYCEIKQNEVWNVGDYNVHTVQVELSEEFNGLVNKVRYFVEDNSYDMLITDNVAQVPYEATVMEGTIKIGVYGYDADTDILVQSTSPVNKYIASGTYTGEADNTEPLTPTDKQQIESAIQQNTDDIIVLQNNKQDVLISGENIKTINNESILGSGNIEIGGGGGGTSNYNALTNKPKINNVELNGNKTSSDLGLQPAGNYVTDTDYATEIKAGLVRTDPEFQTIVQETGILCAGSVNYDSYGNMYSSAFISKGTLENVITGKNLETSNNKVTSISSSSTNTEYPSAKAVYDYIQSLNGDEVNY